MKSSLRQCNIRLSNRILRHLKVGSISSLLEFRQNFLEMKLTTIDLFIADKVILNNIIKY